MWADVESVGRPDAYPTIAVAGPCLGSPPMNVVSHLAVVHDFHCSSCQTPETAHALAAPVAHTVWC
jgi:hypothetical protein